MSWLKWVMVDLFVFFLNMSMLCCKFIIFCLSFLISVILIIVFDVDVMFLFRIFWFFLVINFCVNISVIRVSSMVISWIWIDDNMWIKKVLFY